MKKRKKLTKKGSKRLFRRTSLPRKINVAPAPMRGGFRI